MFETLNAIKARGFNDKAFCSRFRAKLDRFGAATIFDFLTHEDRLRFENETLRLRAKAHRYDTWYNPFNERKPRMDTIKSPSGFRSRFCLYVVDGSSFTDGSDLKSFYRMPAFLQLMQVLSNDSCLRRYMDTGACLNVTFMGHGDRVGWHFDTCDVVAALVLKVGRGGGQLHFSTRDRTELCQSSAHITDVVNSPTNHSFPIPYREGSLVIFRGRHALHRIGPVLGPEERIVALMSFDATAASRVTQSLQSTRYVRSSRRTKSS